MPDLEMLPVWAGRMAEAGLPPQPPLPPRRYANGQVAAPAHRNGHHPADNGSTLPGPGQEPAGAEPVTGVEAVTGQSDEDGPPPGASTITSELPVVSIPFEDETYDDPPVHNDTIEPPSAHGAPPVPIDALIDPADAPIDPADALIDPADAPIDPADAPIDPVDALIDTVEAPVADLVAWPDLDGPDGYEADMQVVEAEIVDEADGTGVRRLDDEPPPGGRPFGGSPLDIGLFEAEAEAAPTHPGLVDEIVYEPDEIELLAETADPISIVPSSPPVSPVESHTLQPDLRKDPPRLADRTGGRRLSRVLGLLVVALVVVAAGVAAGYLFTSLSG